MSDMTREEVARHLGILLSNRCWDCRYEHAGNKVCEEKCVFKQAVDEAIKALTEPGREEILKAIDYRRKYANIDSRIVLDEVANMIRGPLSEHVKGGDAE